MKTWPDGKRIYPRFTGFFLISTAVLVGGWAALAAYFQIDAPLLWPSLFLIAAITATVVGLAQRRPFYAWLLLAAEIVAVSFWWSSVKPSGDRYWAADVQHGVTADIHGQSVQLHNVRNFDWRTDADFTPRWETRHYDLDKLDSVDLFSSVWDNPAIAHTLISFGFSDGARVVFSAEIRREKHEVFSEIGGFFRKFELVLIAADEHDIIRLRTNVRKEEVSLFPLRVTREQARALFLSYLVKANQLAREPQFYQTVTANCTTLIFQLARLVDPGIPIDWRILLSGYLPDYLYDLGIVRNDLPLAEIKRAASVSRRAQGTTASEDYSRVIRDGGTRKLRAGA